MAARNLEQDIDALAQSLDEIRASIARLTDALGTTARNAAAEGRHQAERMAHAALDGVEDGMSSLSREVEQRPLTSVGIAFLLGIITGKLILR